MRLITTYYNKVSAAYDSAITKTNAWRAPVECLALLNGYLRRGSSVLDLGIGTGLSLAFMVRRYSPSRIIGIDISKDMLSYAKLRFPKARLIRGDIEEPLPISKHLLVDLVFAVGVIEFVRNIEHLLAEISAHTASGGLICFTYEELIPHSSLQRWRKSPRGRGLFVHIPAILTFPVYRHTWTEVQRLLVSEGLTILRHSRFRAYSLKNHETKSKYPVIYRAVVVRKN